MFERSTHWFDSIIVDLPEYSGSPQTEVFLDWLDQIECIFEYKEVHENKKVKLIALKLSSRASAWWQQLKKTRERRGKPKIQDWEKMVLREQFLLFNYTQTMYQHMQNLRQGSRSIDDYTEQFYQLVARNDLAESKQMVTQYLEGLR